MATYEERLATFTLSPTPWPHKSPTPQPKDLAAAGFKFVPTSRFPDLVECSRCLLKLATWRPNDNAFTRHNYSAPTCPAALQGQEASTPYPTVQGIGSSDSSVQNNSSELRLDSSTTPVKASEYSETGIIDMESYKKRLATFTSWPHDSPSTTDLAVAGFVYAPSQRRRDEVQCIECGQHLSDWKPNDIPLGEHIRFSPHCALVNKIKDAYKRGTPSAPQSLSERATQPAAQPTAGIKSQPATEASSLSALFEKCQQDPSKRREQQSMLQLLQKPKSKQDQQERLGHLETTTQDSKQEQIDDSTLKFAQTTSVPAATSPVPLKLSSVPINIIATPATPAVAETATPRRPTTPPPASSPPSGHQPSGPSYDAKARKVLEETNISEESMEKTEVEVGDWVELDIDGEEKDDWVQV